MGIRRIFDGVGTAQILDLLEQPLVWMGQRNPINHRFRMVETLENNGINNRFQLVQDFATIHSMYVR